MLEEQEQEQIVGVVIGRVRGCASTTLVCGDTQWEYHGHALYTSLLTCIWTVKGKAALRAGCYALWPPIRANRCSAPVHFLPVSRSRPIFLIMQMCARAREVRALFAHVLCESWRAQDLQVIITHTSLAWSNSSVLQEVWDRTIYSGRSSKNILIYYMILV